MSEMPFRLDFLPREMIEAPRWGLWCYELRDDKPTKVPMRPDGKRASSTNPNDWGDFSRVCAVAVRQRENYAGLGFRLGDGWIGVDLDKCWDGERFEPWAEEIIYELDSYTEISPSGAGAKIFIHGTFPEGPHRRKGGIEMYPDGRYFTVTGDRINGVSPNVEERTAELALVHARIFPPEEAKPRPVAGVTTMDDNRIVDTASRAKNGAEFLGLWRGLATKHTSSSERDLALCSHLLFYAQGDRGVADRLFRQSGLYRDKWDERHGALTYGEMTLNKALSEMASFYKPPAGPQTSTKWDFDVTK